MASFERGDFPSFHLSVFGRAKMVVDDFLNFASFSRKSPHPKRWIFFSIGAQEQVLLAAGN